MVMKNKGLLLLFFAFVINNVYSQDYDILNIDDTGYYLKFEKEEYGPYKSIYEYSEYPLINGTIIFQICYLLYYSWDKCDHQSMGIIYFSDSVQSDFLGIPIVSTFTIKILNMEYTCNIYKLFEEYTNQDYPGKIFTDDRFYSEIIIGNNKEYIHIIAEGYSEEDSKSSIDKFSTLNKRK
jgi:hypothetical protein